MKDIFTAFFMSWGMFLSVPCPVRRWDDRLRNLMLLCLPFTGLIIGGLWALAAVLLTKARCPLLLRAGLICFLPHVLSGFMHLDGFMDCADAILSRRDAETKLKILKDSHVGSFAVISVVILALLDFSAAASLFPPENASGLEYTVFLRKALALIFIPAASRSCSVFSLFFFRPLSHSSYSSMSKKGKIAAAVIMAAFSLAPVFIIGPSGFSCIAVSAVSMLFVYFGIRNLGGMSGDISGLAITAGELSGLISLSFL